MRLLSLRVEQVRQFRNPVVLDDLQPGINLIHGPNESGKSTLVRAIRAAFFERYRSKSVEDLRPWGDSAAAPTIELTFEQKGQKWQLAKSFLQKKRCDLIVGSTAFNGEEAEGRLSELMGYQFPKKGASKDEHWGIPGLLWVEQGTGQDIERAVAYAGEHLETALTNLVGDVASSGGDDVIQAVEKMRGELLTATGKPRGEYQQAEKMREELQSKISDLEHRVDHYRDQVDRLTILSEQFDQANIERPWEEARKKAREASEHLRKVEDLENQKKQESNTLEHLRSQLSLLQERQTQMQSESAKLSERAAEAEQAKQRLEQAKARGPLVNKALDEAKAGYGSAEKILEKVRAQEKRDRLERQLAELQAQKQNLGKNLDKAGEYVEQLDECRAQRDRNRIDEQAVQQLARLQRQLSEEGIRSQAIATRLTWNLDGGKHLLLNGEPIDGEGEKRLLDESTLEMDGVGTLSITPGGEDLAAARRKLTDLQKRVETQLQDLNVRGLEEAEKRLKEFTEATRQSSHLGELLKSVAPEGVNPLKAKLQSIQSEMGQCEAALSELPTPTTEDRQMLPDLSAAERAFKDAGKRLSEAESRQREQETAVLKAGQNLDSANREWQRLKDELSTPERAQRLEKTARDIAEVARQQQGTEKTLAELTSKIQQARPDLLKQDIERFQDTAETQERLQRTRERELGEIRARLEAWGAEGLEEQRNEKTAELERLTRRFNELHRRVLASDLLLNLLNEKRQTLTRRLQAPLQKHLNHYVSVLFPEASLEVDDQLVPRKFTRGNELGEMAELSFGAREQMGLISRLAYADLLQEAGRPTLIILDDTLVHSDSQRLDGMKRILFDAAQRHQILLFTCHPEKWRDLGVEPKDIRALKTLAPL